jgi:hypothetical protein
LILATLCALSAPAKKRDRCFETHGATSKKAAALFERRQLQGGGPTWLAILETLVKDRATVVRPAEPEMHLAPGACLIVRYHDRETWYCADDEAEGALFCAGDKELFSEIRAEHKRLNQNVADLAKLLDRIPDLE